MRMTRAFLTIAIIVAGFASLQAREPSIEAATTPPSVDQPLANSLPADLWTADKTFQVSILKNITARKSKTRDEDRSARLDELGTLYAADFQGPLWLNGDRLTDRAREALTELRRANEWALDPADYEITTPANGFLDEAERAQFEVDFSLNLLKYADHARRGRFRPSEMSLWYERASNGLDYMDFLRRVAAKDSPAALIAAQHPQHEGFKNLRQVYLQRVFPDRFKPGPSKSEDRQPKPIVLDYGDSVRRGQRHPQIAMLRDRLKVPAASAAEAELYDVDVMNAVNDFMRTQGWRRKHVYDNKVRKALNGATGATTRKTNRQINLDDIVANMEKWRWLPRELGDIYVWNNLPSYKTRVIKRNHVIHEERIIIGKTKTQTPVFSDTMTHVVFKPQWGVPGSIKVKSLLPRLASGDLDVLRRRGMRVQYGDDKIVSPSKINWNRTDITTIPIVMGAGSSNPLGRVKFMFPNHHSVYMHDTPDRHLFQNSERLFSHGCIRVRDPVRFAEVILGETTNWTTTDVDQHLASRAKENNRIDLGQKVSVHNTYFTVMADADGKIETLPDIYGHDKRIKDVLAGKSLKLIAANDPARLQKQEIEQLARAPPAVKTHRQRGSGTIQYEAAYGLGGPPAWYIPPKPKKVYKKKKKSKPHNWSLHPYQNYFQGF
ncbi:MAG: L,D-transpeptidase family protein [Alphaproteobacteria bacterium]|nr:L,D-transpeptidase family protein [Alphaproteobacteria bacterium]